MRRISIFALLVFMSALTVPIGWTQEWREVYKEDFESVAIGEKPEGWTGGVGDDTDGAAIFWYVSDFVGYDNEPEDTTHNLSIGDNSEEGNAIIAVPFPAQTENFKLTIYVGNNRPGSSFLRIALGDSEDEGLDNGGRLGIGYLNLNMNTTNGLTPNFNSTRDGMTVPHSNAAMHKIEYVVVRNEDDTAYDLMSVYIDDLQVLPPFTTENPRTQINLMYLITSTGGTNVDLSIDDITVEVGGEGFEAPPDLEFTAQSVVSEETFEEVALGEVPEGWVPGDGDDSDGSTVVWGVSDYTDFNGLPDGSAKTLYLQDEFDSGNIIAEAYFDPQDEPIRLSFYVGTTELSTGDENDDTVRVAMGYSAEGAIASSGMDGIGYMDVTFRSQDGNLKLDFNNNEHPSLFSIPHEDGQMHFVEYIVFRDADDTMYEMRKAYIDGEEAYPLSLVEFQRTSVDMMRFITYTGGFHHIYLDNVTVEIGTQEEVTDVRLWELY